MRNANMRICDMRSAICGMRYANIRYAVCEYAICEYAICEYAICDMQICDIRICDMRICDMRICDMRICEYAIYWGELGTWAGGTGQILGRGTGGPRNPDRYCFRTIRTPRRAWLGNYAHGDPNQEVGSRDLYAGGSCPHIPRELFGHTSGCMVERATHSHPSANWWERRE